MGLSLTSCFSKCWFEGATVVWLVSKLMRCRTMKDDERVAKDCCDEGMTRRPNKQAIACINANTVRRMRACEWVLLMCSDLTLVIDIRGHHTFSVWRPLLDFSLTHGSATRTKRN